MIVHFKRFFKRFSTVSKKVGAILSWAGVICEFNPFHNGHKFLLEKIKKEYADEIVCIMSGSFVQRGDIAIADKYLRTTSALRFGADVVIELPTPYALSSARIFADNGVRIAAQMNCDILCFGAENSLEELIEVAEQLEKESVNDTIRSEMQSGQYYPKALSTALGAEHAEIVNQPNNILALEYIKACRKYGIRPVAIPRKGVGHNEDATRDGVASASKIRELIQNGEPYQLLTPMAITHMSCIKSIEPAVLYRLKTITADELAKIADVSEGLENRIIEAAKQYNSLEEIYKAVKTKRYTMARIRRIVINAFLGVTSELQNTPVPYLRVLGIGSGMEGLFRSVKLPLVIKTRADCEKLDSTAKEIFEIDLRAAEAMNLAGGQIINEFTKGIIKL